MASGLSKAMQSTMSWPLLRFAPSEPCQVSPPSRNRTLSLPRSARTRLTTAASRSMRPLAFRLPDAEVDRRLAEIDRHQLAVNIGHVQQRDIAGRVEPEQVAFGQ